MLGSCSREFRENKITPSQLASRQSGTCAIDDNPSNDRVANKNAAALLETLGRDVSQTKFSSLNMTLRNYCHSLPTVAEPLRCRRKRRDVDGSPADQEWGGRYDG